MGKDFFVVRSYKNGRKVLQLGEGPLKVGLCLFCFFYFFYFLFFFFVCDLKNIEGNFRGVWF